jgi:hypothetical protein
MTGGIDMKVLGQADWHVKFEIIATPDYGEELSSFVSHIDTKIMLLDEDGEETKQIGSASMQIIHADRALNEHTSLFDICDADSQELHEVWEAVYNTQGLSEQDEFDGVSKGILKLFGGNAPLDKDTLVVDVVQIDPEYRGQDISLDVVDAAINTFGNGVGYIILKPYPIGVEHKSKKFRSALKSIQIHWSRMGFKKLPKSGVHVADFFVINTMFIRPVRKPKGRARAATAGSGS